MADAKPGHGNADRLHRYWVHGEGAAKIRWGEPGDFDRCTRQLMEHAKFTEEQAHGYCNLAHHAALGVYPATHAAAEKGNVKRGAMDGTDAERAQLDTKKINDLPDSAFAYIEPGGTKDADGKTVPRSKRHFPIHDAAHVRNALARAPQSPYGEKAMPKIRAAAKKMGIGQPAEANRAGQVEPLPYARSWALDDIQILRSADGHADGRTVEAYAAVFNTPTEITDQHGHYMEVISPKAFKRVLDHGIERVGVYYHHALTVHGTPSDLGSVPIGSPVEIRADGRGLRTVTRYNRSALADSVLEAIRNGDIRGYSFRGRIYKSNPARIPKTRGGGALPTVTRTELGLTEYGPTPTPAYTDAGILAMRSALDEIRDELVSLSRTISPSTPQDPDDDLATPDLGLGAEDSRDAHSDRQRELIRLRAALRDRGL